MNEFFYPRYLERKIISKSLMNSDNNSNKRHYLTMTP